MTDPLHVRDEREARDSAATNTVDRPTSSEFVLEVRDFSVDYGVGSSMVRAVSDVSLNLRRSSVLGVAGESGSGKSTLVYAMTRLLRAPGVISAGNVMLNVTDDHGNALAPVDLVRANEITGGALLTFHNLFFFNAYVDKMRQKIAKGIL